MSVVLRWPIIDIYKIAVIFLKLVVSCSDIAAGSSKQLNRCSELVAVCCKLAPD